MTNPTLKEQIAEITDKHWDDLSSRKCNDALLALFTADRKAHSEAMVGVMKAKDAMGCREEVCSLKTCPACVWSAARQALIQASARYQEGEGV